MNTRIKFCMLLTSVLALGGCSTVKTIGKIASLPVTLPVKGVMKTGQLAGKSVYYTGKGVYRVAKVPVDITNAALDTSVKVLTVTTQVVDLSGKVVDVSRTMQRGEVDAYINQAKGAANVLGIFVDVARTVTGP